MTIEPIRSVAVTQCLANLDDSLLRDRAAQELYDKYSAKLISLVQRKLNRRFRGAVDPDDVVQSVWISFHRNQKQGKFDLKNRFEFVRLIVAIAMNKAIDAVRKMDAQMRAPTDREVGSDVSPERKSKRTRDLANDVVKRNYRSDEPVVGDLNADSFFDMDPIRLFALGANPEQAFGVVEIMELAFADLPPDLQIVLAGLLEGASNKDIAKRLDDCELETVRRKIEMVCRKIAKLTE